MGEGQLFKEGGAAHAGKVHSSGATPQNEKN